MTSIVFDAGPVISLTTNGLLWTLEKLKFHFKGRFLISKAIMAELVDKPLEGKKFKFEALKVHRYVEKGVLELFENKELENLTNKLLGLANNSFFAQGNPIKLVHYGEMSGLAVAILDESEAYVVDERTTRLIIENPNKLKNILRHTLHTEIKVNKQVFKELKGLIGNIKIIRSTELATIAYELGILDIYLTNLNYPKETLIESVLWGLKLNGCSVSRKDIERIIRLESKR